MTSHAAERDHDAGEDPFSTKGGSVFVESLDAMVLTPATRRALGDAVARGRHRQSEESGPPAPRGTTRTPARDASREARAS